MPMTTKGAVNAAPAQPDNHVCKPSCHNPCLLDSPKTEKPKPTLPVGVSVLLTNERGQVLLAKRKNNSGAGLLSTPGGRLELAENILQCACREFTEETGAYISGDPTVIAWREHFRFGNHYIMFYVHATGHVGEISNRIPDKSEDWAWFDFANIEPETCTEPNDILAMLYLLTIKAKQERS